MGVTLSNNEQPALERMLLKDDRAIFILGCFLLIVILTAGYFRDDIQYNIIWLVVLSLNVAMLFAFLPFSANVDVGWFKAGGTAAILAVCLFKSMDVAERGLAKQLNVRDELVQRLRNDLDAAQTTIKNATAKSAPAQQTVVNSVCEGLPKSIASLRTVVERSQQNAFAASTNTSDNRGCVARAVTADQLARSALEQLRNIELLVAGSSEKK